MPRLRFRGSVIRAAAVVALLASGSAQAQVAPNPGPAHEPGGVVNDFVTGVQFDLANRAKAEQRIRHLQAKLARDTELGKTDAAERDVHRLDYNKYRFAVAGWLIKYNRLCDPGYYPLRTDPVEQEYLAQVARHQETQAPPQPTLGPPPVVAAPIAITIANANPTGPGLPFAIDGTTYQAAGGSRQDLSVAPTATITYEGGGTHRPATVHALARRLRVPGDDRRLGPLQAPRHPLSGRIDPHHRPGPLVGGGLFRVDPSGSKHSDRSIERFNRPADCRRRARRTRPTGPNRRHGRPSWY